MGLRWAALPHKLAGQGANLPAATKARRRDREGPIQTAMVRYLEATLPDAWIVHHSAMRPRSKAQGAREKRMGAKKGFPDLIILGEGRTYFIEVKDDRAGADTSEAQDEFHDRLQAAGFPPVGIARTLDDVADLVRRWHLPTRHAMPARPPIPRRIA